MNALKAKPVGGAEWLLSLRDSDLEEVIKALSTLPGVGPKVAACVALFSLDQHHAIPVDTHVWQVVSPFSCELKLFKFHSYKPKGLCLSAIENFNPSPLWGLKRGKILLTGRSLCSN